MSSNGLKDLKDDLQKFEIRLKKSFGQNFLHDPVAINRIMDACNIKHSDWVVEIGAGSGYLTSALAINAHQVIAIEIDSDLRPLLLKTTGLTSNIKLIFGDVLDMDLSSLKPTVVVGNLPYYCSSAILRRWADQTPDIPAFFMLPEDVVKHLLASPGDASYTAFSVYAQYAFSFKKLFEVHPSSFFPRPNVGSAFVSFDQPKTPRLPKRAEDHFTKVVEGAFMLRRKTMVNSLSEAGFDTNDVKSAMSFIGLEPNVRGETLNVDQFKRLAGFIPH
ncbi:MAG: ribosomal RNA small subunit methyltransferase A [Caldisericales bacterium]|nr:ribosomal RNA small subunit methyltransferase A [Caldisericales bacterium]